MKKLKIVFLTGTRADYGKLKPLIRLCDKDPYFEVHIYVTGMHLLYEYGHTIDDIIADGYCNIHPADDFKSSINMDENLALTILSFSKFVKDIRPDLIVVHGDRTEPLAGAIVGTLNSIRVAHIEGGEVTGTADEFMRHAVTKLCSLHFAANNEAKYRLLQLGERESDIFVIGSPDIDIMLSDGLPDEREVKRKHGIGFNDHAICIYHPVTTSNDIYAGVEQLINAMERSERNYIIIYPNNDNGSDIIKTRLNRLAGNPRFQMFCSLPFEDFIVLLKHSDFIIGNSSAGIREACVYAIPAIDIGTRQNKRYNPAALRNIQHVSENCDDILRCIGNVKQFHFRSNYFGNGNSAELFVAAIKSVTARKPDIQKEFVDLEITSQAIMTYINEVCF
jgi:UDP-N-acetylglucosamine 2-epimerase (hydrolysing)